MDTEKLVVGQEVYLSTCYGFVKFKVVKATPEGVEVKSEELWGTSSQDMKEIGIVRLDSNGVELEADRLKRFGFEPPEPGDRFMQFIVYEAPEFEPWKLDTMPFEERTAQLKPSVRPLP